MKIRPLHDRVIVKRMEEERKTASGIVIPDTVRVFDFLGAQVDLTSSVLRYNLALAFLALAIVGAEVGSLAGTEKVVSFPTGDTNA